MALRKGSIAGQGSLLSLWTFKESLSQVLADLRSIYKEIGVSYSSSPWEAITGIIKSVTHVSLSPDRLIKLVRELFNEELRAGWGNEPEGERARLGTQGSP